MFKRKPKPTVRDFTPEQIQAVISADVRKQLEGMQRAEFNQIVHLSGEISLYEQCLPYWKARLDELWKSYDERKKILGGDI